MKENNPLNTMPEVNETQSSKIHWHAIVQQENPTYSLLEQLRSRIDAEEYGLIVGDQLSGHIPAIIITNTINKLYLEKDMRPIPLIFLEGSLYSLDQDRIRHEFVSKRSRLRNVDKNKRALIVTDFIDKGRTIKNFHQALNPFGISFDVALISSDKAQYLPDGSQSDFYIELENLTSAKYFIGSNNNNYAGDLYHKYHLSGLNKNRRLTGAGKFDIHPHSREVAREVLRDIRILSDRLVTRYNDSQTM